MLSSKIAPRLDSSWQLDSDFNETPATSLSTPDLRLLNQNVPLWIRTDGSSDTDGIENLNLGTDVAHARIATQATWMLFAQNSAASNDRSDAEKLGSTSRPIAIGQIESTTMPSIQSLSQFEGFEFVCSSKRSDMADQKEPELELLRIVWPLDVESTEQMICKIHALRALSNSKKPVGISIPLSNLSDTFFASVNWLLDCGFDWITWRLPAACIGRQHDAIEYLINDPFQALQAIKEWQHASKAIESDATTNQLPLSTSPSPLIAIEYPWRTGYQAAHIIRSGADIAVLPSNTRYACNAPVAVEAETKPRPSNSTLSNDFFSATLGYRPTSFQESHSHSNSVNPASAAEKSSQINSKNDDLERFVSQMIDMLEWSAS